MKLNYDCLRKTLMALEEVLTLRDDYGYQSIGVHEIIDNPNISNEFDKKDIAYCLYMMIDAGLIEETQRTPLTPCRERCICTITYKGHEFLDNVRDNDIWKETKEKAVKVGSVALNILSQIAANVISARLA